MHAFRCFLVNFFNKILSCLGECQDLHFLPRKHTATSNSRLTFSFFFPYLSLALGGDQAPEGS